MSAINDATFDLTGFSYEPASGSIFKNGRRRDFQDDLYRKVTSRGKDVRAHRLAWRLYYGQWPTLEVDHRNRNPRDNRITNLRLATHGQNQANDGAMKNNRSGERGVYWCRTWRKWKILLMHNHKTFTGTASHKISAILAARLIRRVLHGEFGTQEGA